MNSRKSYLLMLCLKEREESSRERGEQRGNSRRDLQEFMEVGMTQSQPTDSKNFRLSHI